MGCNAQQTTETIYIPPLKNTVERVPSEKNIYTSYPEVQPYIVELFSKIIPDKKTVGEVLTRISQQSSCVSDELCKIVDPDNTGIIEVEG